MLKQQLQTACSFAGHLVEKMMEYGHTGCIRLLIIKHSRVKLTSMTPRHHRAVPENTCEGLRDVLGPIACHWC